MDSGRASGSALPRYPAAERNKQPILEVLKRALPGSGTLLEIASGTGQHAVHFAAELPSWTIQPTELDSALVDVIRRRREEAALPNVLPPLGLNVLDASWPVGKADAILAVNLLHVAPWSVTRALMRGAAAAGRDGSLLLIYGPFRRAGVPLEPSNAAFDDDLKARHPEWGLRLVEDVAEAAAEHGWSPAGVVEMPANNLVLTFRR